MNQKSLRRSTLMNQAGMTLLEIMIVIMILGSLGAILGRTVIVRAKKAKVEQAKIQISEISKNLDMYYTDCGHYPSTEQGLAALAPGGESTCSSWGPEPYINKVPVDPWNTPYFYSLDGGSFTITSFGADQKEGGTGYNADISNN